MEVGDWDGPALWRVDLWVADQRLTCDDNMALAKQFRHYVASTAVWVRSGEVPTRPFAGLSPGAIHRRLHAGIMDGEQEYEQFGFFHRWGWGPTTDNVTAFLWRDGVNRARLLKVLREDSGGTIAEAKSLHDHPV
ncbi:hypothetical protein [Actinocorallia lasiicapitis]